MCIVDFTCYICSSCTQRGIFLNAIVIGTTSKSIQAASFFNTYKFLLIIHNIYGVCLDVTALLYSGEPELGGGPDR